MDILKVNHSTTVKFEFSDHYLKKKKICSYLLTLQRTV